MQSDSIQTRFRRYLRKRAAKGLVIAGLSVLSVLFLLCLIYALYTWSFRYLAELAVVALFGVLGAYFSRVMSFQSKLKLIGFEDVTNLYQLWMLTLRALYGAIGAVVLYFFCAVA
jgi:hypothetical protein